MPGIEILLNFVPNPRKISPFSKKKLSQQNLGLLSVMAAKKPYERQRDRWKGLMSSTVAVHVRYNSGYISLPSSAKQEREL